MCVQLLRKRGTERYTTTPLLVRARPGPLTHPQLVPSPYQAAAVWLWSSRSALARALRQAATDEATDLAMEAEIMRMWWLPKDLAAARERP